MNRELTEEGKKMFEQLLKMTGDEEVVIEHAIKSRRKAKEIKDYNPYELELKFIKLEIMKLIENSKLVIVDCDYLISKFKTAEEYMLSDVKVAKTLHEGLINRLTRVFKGLPAFEDESHLPKIELNPDPTELYGVEPWYNRELVANKAT